MLCTLSGERSKCKTDSSIPRLQGTTNRPQGNESPDSHDEWSRAIKVKRPFREGRLWSAFRRRSVVWLMGVRRVGKTVLARSLPRFEAPGRGPPLRGAIDYDPERARDPGVRGENAPERRRRSQVPIRKRYMLAGVLVAAAGALLLFREVGQPDYAASLEEWRRDRFERLTADQGWLAVAGLFWLEGGDSRAGTESGSPVLLPPRSAPPRVGVFRRAAGRVEFIADPGAAVTSSGRPVTTIEMKDDTIGTPDMIVVNDLTMFIIKRGDRLAVRLRDKNRRERREFAGLDYFPIREEYRVVAEWVPYDPSRAIAIPNVLGASEDLPCPGYARFTIGGKELRLEPVIEQPGDEELFFVFADETNGFETYPSGRFLHAAQPRDGTIILDFNKAYNPPCAFTPFATCPLPPPQNRLAARIEAGEKRYAGH